jgi:hypothetical protein
MVPVHVSTLMSRVSKLAIALAIDLVLLVGAIVVLSGRGDLASNWNNSPSLIINFFIVGFIAATALVAPFLVARLVVTLRQLREARRHEPVPEARVVRR